MKLLRFGESGQESWGVLDQEGHIRNLADAVDGLAGGELSVGAGGHGNSRWQNGKTRQCLINGDNNCADSE